MSHRDAAAVRSRKAADQARFRARRRAARAAAAANTQWPPAAWSSIVEPPGRGTPRKWALRGTGG